VNLFYNKSTVELYEYTEKNSDKVWIVRVPGTHIETLYKQVLAAKIYHSLNVQMAHTLITKVGVSDSREKYAIASEKIRKLNLFESTFVSNLAQSASEFQNYSDNIIHNIKLKGLMELLAVAKFLGDTDCLGDSSQKAGFVRINGQNLGVIHNIDPSFNVDLDVETNISFKSRNLWLSAHHIF